MKRYRKNKLYIFGFLILFFLLAQAALLAVRMLKPPRDAAAPAAKAGER